MAIQVSGPARKTGKPAASTKSRKTRKRAKTGKVSAKITGPVKDENISGYSDFHSGKFWQTARYLNPELDAGEPDAVFRKDIFFGVVETPDIMPAEQQKLKDRIESTLSTLKLIYEKDDVDEKQKEQNRTRFNEAYDKLFSLATLGLGQENSSPGIADAALNSLQAEIVGREAGQVKNAYLERLGRPALGAGIVFALLFLIYEYLPGCSNFVSVCGDTDYEYLFPAEVHKYRHVFLVLAGCMAGTWASFGARKVKLTFFDLAILEQDRLAPKMRLIFTGVLTVILTLIITTGLIDIVIGGFKASALLDMGGVAVLFGAFAGLSEKTLPAAIGERATGFLDAVNA